MGKNKRVYKYGMRLRGASPGAQPAEGLLEVNDDPLQEYHSILLYNRPLSPEEVKDYELDYLYATIPEFRA